MLECQLGHVRRVVRMADRVPLRRGVPTDPPATMNVAVVLAVQQPAGPEQADVSDDAGPPQIPATAAVRSPEKRQEVGDPPHLPEYPTSLRQPKQNRAPTRRILRCGRLKRPPLRPAVAPAEDHLPCPSPRPSAIILPVNRGIAVVAAAAVFGVGACSSHSLPAPDAACPRTIVSGYAAPLPGHAPSKTPDDALRLFLTLNEVPPTTTPTHFDPSRFVGVMPLPTTGWVRVKGVVKGVAEYEHKRADGHADYSIDIARTKEPSGWSINGEGRCGAA
jgi:hypothetical protein